MSKHHRYLLASVVLGISGCTGAAASPAQPKPVTQRANESTSTAATVKLKPESAQYVEVSTAAIDDTESALRAPAHVAFKGGAVSQIGGPIAGRVSTVHVKVGDVVKRGDPLVTIQSPAAASARAD